MKARENPFRSECIDRLRFRPMGWTWDEFDARLHAQNYRGAIVGPKGSGKTTLLEELTKRFHGQGFTTIHFRLNAEYQVLPILPASFTGVVILDGAEQLESRAWQRFLVQTRLAAGIIVTSHSPGLLPTLVECSTDLNLLDNLLCDLLNADAIFNLGSLPERLFSDHHGNIRMVFRDLYDHLANDNCGLVTLSRP